MVEARIDQLQAHDPTPENLGDLDVCPWVRPETRSGQDDLAHRQQISLALVNMPSLNRAVSVRPQPLRIGDRLMLTLRVFETRNHGRAVEYQPAVGGVDHVGQAGYRLHQVDGG